MDLDWGLDEEVAIWCFEDLAFKKAMGSAIFFKPLRSHFELKSVSKLSGLQAEI